MVLTPRRRRPLLKPRSKLEVGSWKLEVGSWKLEVGSWKLEAGSWKLEAGSWKLEAGSWKLEVGSWKLEVGSWKLGVGSWELEVGDFFDGGNWAVCSLVAKVHDWDLEFWWFKSRCGHDKIRTPVEALNPALLQEGIVPCLV